MSVLYSKSHPLPIIPLPTALLLNEHPPKASLPQTHVLQRSPSSLLPWPQNLLLHTAQFPLQQYTEWNLCQAGQAHPPTRYICLHHFLCTRDRHPSTPRDAWPPRRTWAPPLLRSIWVHCRTCYTCGVCGGVLVVAGAAWWCVASPLLLLGSSFPVT